MRESTGSPVTTIPRHMRKWWRSAGPLPQRKKFDLTDPFSTQAVSRARLCLSATLWARIGHVYFAADRHGAARAGFDDAVFYEYFAGTRPELLPVEHAELAASDEPFDAWRNHATARTQATERRY